MAGSISSKDSDFKTLLKQFTSFPSGSAVDWKTHYAPLVNSVITHHEKTNPVLSVIVVAYRSSEILLDCLKHIRIQEDVNDSEVELILIDNTGIESLRTSLPDWVDIEIRMAGNTHACRARNLGAAFASAPVVNFVDDDGLMHADYLKHGLKYFIDDRIAGVRTRIEALNHRYFTTIAYHYSRGSDVVEDYLMTEGSMFIRRDIFIDVGGFCEALYGGDGIDLTYRIFKAYPNVKIFYIPDAVLKHDFVDSWKKFVIKYWRYTPTNLKFDEIDPDFERFREEYPPQRFIRDPLTIDKYIAFIFLHNSRKILWRLAKIVKRIKFQFYRMN